MSSTAEDYETVAQFVPAAEAHMLRAHLESQGIPVVLADEHLAALNWFVSSAVGGIRVQVPRRCVPDAQEIIAAVRSGACALSSDDSESPAGAVLRGDVPPDTG